MLHKQRVFFKKTELTNAILDTNDAAGVAFGELSDH